MGVEFIGVLGAGHDAFPVSRTKILPRLRSDVIQVHFLQVREEVESRKPLCLARLIGKSLRIGGIFLGDGTFHGNISRWIRGHGFLKR
jgi:hypothetical protein